MEPEAREHDPLARSRRSIVRASLAFAATGLRRVVGTDAVTNRESPDRTGRAREIRLVGVLVVLLVWAFFLVTGLMGLDFGRHWDEPALTLAVAETLRTGVFLPVFYAYPSVPYWLMVAPEASNFWVGLPKAAQCISEVDAAAYMSWIPCYEAWKSHAMARFAPDHLVLRARVLFLSTGSLSVIFTALLAWRWRGRMAEAVLAASILGLSWETAYHARWTAPDAVLMAVSAATLWLTAESMARNDTRWIHAAAITAAVGAATKLTGAILLLPVLLAGALLLAPSPSRRRAMIRRALRLSALFVVTFLLLCPGALVEPFQFVIEILHERRHYATGHGAYTVGLGPEHLLRMVEYLLKSWYTPYEWVGVALGACAILGGVRARAANPKTFLVLVVPLALYVLYLSTHRVMFVRNLLLLLPVLATCSAWGLLALAESWRPGYVKPTVIFLTIVLLGANGFWLASRARAVASSDWSAGVHRAHETVAERQSTTFFLSPGLRRSMDQLRLPTPANVTDVPTRSSIVVSWLHEIPVEALPANRSGTFTLGLTAPHVNLDYYPTWVDRDVVVAVETRTLPPKVLAGLAGPSPPNTSQMGAPSQQ